jgi:hypothetical protein
MKYYIIDKTTNDYLNNGTPFVELYDLEQYLQLLDESQESYNEIIKRLDYSIKVVSDEGEILGDVIKDY